MGWVERARTLVAERAVSEVRYGMILGLGSGRTVAKALEILGKMTRTKEMRVLGVPTSSQTELLCIQYGIPLTTLNEHPQLDLDIDGADQVDAVSLDLIKGGGAALMREKIVAVASKKIIIIVDEEKVSRDGLTHPIPLEILPAALKPCSEAITRLGGRPSLRMGEKKLGPVITDNGNYIVDASFDRIVDPPSLDRDLRSIPGILETGLFLGMADRIYVGMRDGRVKILEKKK